MARRALPAATLALALVTAVVIGLFVGGESESCTASSESAETLCVSEQESLLEREGASVLFVLLVPASLAAIGLLWPRPRVLTGVAIALGVGVLLGALTIGLFFIPTLALAIVAAGRAADR